MRKVKKWNPYSAYTEWNNAWGDTVKPADSDDYEYLIWTIDTEANATQPYNLTFRDTFNETDAMLLGYRGSSGTYQPSLTITNSRSQYLAFLSRYSPPTRSIPHPPSRAARHIISKLRVLSIRAVILGRLRTAMMPQTELCGTLTISAIIHCWSSKRMTAR